VTDLTEPLRARLDEDEAEADAASGGEWGAIDHTRPFTVFDVAAYQKYNGRSLTGRYAVGAIERPEDRAHIARHDPARVLAEVEAKRGIIREAFHHAEILDGESGCCPAAAIERGECEDYQPEDLPILRLLAAPYVQHPDYRPEWAPEGSGT
jgi:hypothetical protein